MDIKRKKNPVSNELYHYGTRGMRWGERRYQNPDGTLTPEGLARYGRQGGYLAAPVRKPLTFINNRKERLRKYDIETTRERINRSMNTVKDSKDRLKELSEERKNAKDRVDLNLNKMERKIVKGEKKEAKRDMRSDYKELKKMMNDKNYSTTLNREKKMVKAIGVSALKTVSLLDSVATKKTIGNDKDYSENLSGAFEKILDAAKMGTKKTHKKNGELIKGARISNTGTILKNITGLSVDALNTKFKAYDKIKGFFGYKKIETNTASYPRNILYKRTLGEVETALAEDDRKKKKSERKYNLYSSDRTDYIIVNTNDGYGLYHAGYNGNWITGPRGGLYYLSSTGSKIYQNPEMIRRNTNINYKKPNAHEYDKQVEQLLKDPKRRKDLADGLGEIVDRENKELESLRKIQKQLDNPGKQESKKNTINANKANPSTEASTEAEKEEILNSVREKLSKQLGKADVSTEKAKKEQNKVNKDSDKNLKEFSSKKLNSLSRIADESSKTINRINENIPNKYGQKVYGKYDDVDTKELQRRINRINTERTYSDLIGDTQYYKSGNEKLKEILGYAGAALAVTGSILGIASSIKGLKTK